MTPPVHFAVAHPTRLAFARHPSERDALVLTAGSGRDRLTIVASRERWAELFAEAMTGRVRDPAATARSMFERGEIDVDVFERSLGREVLERAVDAGR